MAMEDELGLKTKVYPFPEILEYDSDGVIVNLNNEPDAKIFIRMALIECPSCKALDDFYATGNEAIFEGQACPGNLPLETKVGRHNLEINCAGILEPHIHVHCICCKRIFFVRMPGEI